MLKQLFKRLVSPAPNRVPDRGDIALADQLIAEGNEQEDTGQLQRAFELYSSAVAAAPGHAGAYLNLGIVLATQGNEAGAARAYQAVLNIEPNHAFGNYNFARLAYLGGDFPHAEALVRVALSAKPDFPQALVLLSNVQDVAGQTAVATQTLAAALHMQPGNAGIWVNQATLLHKLGKLDDAEDAVKQALALDSGNLEALLLLSLLQRSHGFATQALTPLRAAISSHPERMDLLSEELLLLNFEEDIAAHELFRRHMEFGVRLEDAVSARFDSIPQSAGTNRRLRIGYVSGDFFTHPVALFMIPVLEHHSKDGFEVFCYSSGATSDQVTDRLRALSEHWTDAASLSDQQLADAIYADAIDILVDLSGHTGRSRLSVFSQRPAPVQATWLGYLNTTGLTRMDYRLCDLRTDPTAESQPLHTERLLHLPHSQWCYRPFINADVCPTSPCEARGYITFGSFNSALKISPAMCKRWAQILLQVEDSQLLIANVTSERKRAAIRLDMEAMGVAGGRIAFSPRVNLEQYFELFGTVDISLDTFPYGGGTTTLDSLWMGVPVVTALGSTPVSRSAASIVSTLGLDQWVAPSIDDYVKVAAERALDRQAIVLMRQTLRQLLKDSPLTNEMRFVHDLEAAYCAMWSSAGLGTNKQISQGYHA